MVPPPAGGALDCQADNHTRSFPIGLCDMLLIMFKKCNRLLAYVEAALSCHWHTGRATNMDSEAVTKQMFSTLALLYIPW